MIDIKVCPEFVKSLEKLQTALNLLLEVENETGFKFEINQKHVSTDKD